MGVLPYKRNRRTIGQQQAASAIIFEAQFGDIDLHGRRRLPQSLNERPGDVGNQRGFLLAGHGTSQTDINERHLRSGFLVFKPMGAGGHDDLIALLVRQAIGSQDAALVLGTAI